MGEECQRFQLVQIYFKEYSHFHIKKYVFHIFSTPILSYICSISKLDSKEVVAMMNGDTRPII